MPSLCRETSVSRTANVGTVGKNGLRTNFQNRWKFRVKISQSGDEVIFVTEILKRVKKMHQNPSKLTRSHTHR